MLKKLIALAVFIATPALAEPVEQRNFTTFVKSYHDLYVGSTNALVKGEMHAKRDADLKHALNGTFLFRKWELIVVGVNIDPRSGKAWLALASEATPDPTFVLMNLPLDAEDNAIMGLDPRQIEVARSLDQRDRVFVSGTFMRDDANRIADYDAMDRKEEASMRLPKFAVRFLGIAKVRAVTDARPPTPLAPRPSSTRPATR